MATHRIPIFGFSTKPDASGKVWLEPVTILGTNDIAQQLAWRIDEDNTNGTQLSTKAGIYGSFMVPKNYVGSPVIIVVAKSTKTAGDIVLDFDYKPVAAAETLDPAAFNTTDTSTTTIPGTTNLSKEYSITLAAEALAVDDVVEYYLAQDGVAAGDTHAGAILIVGAYLQYADA